MKYGALSDPAGRVDLRWSVSPSERGYRLHLVWRERNGPAVQPPKRLGLGTRLLRPQNGVDDVRLDFAPSGVVCEMEVLGVQPITA